MPLQKTVPALICLLIALLPLSAQTAKPSPWPPVPAPIVAAKKIFIANGGTEQIWDEESQFSGGADRAYTQFYAAMKAWGRYDISDSPADADLRFEIQFASPAAVGAALSVRDSLAGRLYDPQFRLIVRDGKTNALLWTFAERAQWAVTRGNRDKNFDQALDRMVGDVQALAGPPAASAKSQ